jgi:glutamate/tyrosine decarboxylase-like PLP-dependent enzyme
MTEKELLRLTEQIACDFLTGLNERPIATTVDAEELRRRLCLPLSDSGLPAEEVIRDLAEAVEGGLQGSQCGRFFGWVMGGSLPAALAADWLTSAWDQNSGGHAVAPAAAMSEEACGAWLKELLQLPEDCSFALVTGCQMAHVTAMAAARHRLLESRGWNVEARGLAGAPAIRIFVSENCHESILRAVRLLGLGTNNISALPLNDEGTLSIAALERALSRDADKPLLLCISAGDLNCGSFDDFDSACDLATPKGAWVHVDGAFGLWAAASPKYRHLLKGCEKADSWATDGHKWLNLPFDSGFVFVRDRAAHHAAFSQEAAYAIAVAGVREQKDWNPEWSRRARGFAAYAGLRHLGRQGVTDLVERCCAHTRSLVEGIAALPGTEILAPPIINQALVRFLDAGGDHDARTEGITSAIREKGEAWFGTTTWRGMRVMRISVINWRTNDGDVARALKSIAQVLEENPA